MERAERLDHVTASRVKAPKRRPPSSIFLKDNVSLPVYLLPKATIYGYVPVCLSLLKFSMGIGGAQKEYRYRLFCLVTMRIMNRSAVRHYTIDALLTTSGAGVRLAEGWKIYKCEEGASLRANKERTVVFANNRLLAIFCVVIQIVKLYCTGNSQFYS